MKDPILIDRAHHTPIEWAHLSTGDQVFYLEQPCQVVHIFRTGHDAWRMRIATKQGFVLTVALGDSHLVIPRSASIF